MFFELWLSTVKTWTHLETSVNISLVSWRFVSLNELFSTNILRVKTGDGGVTLTKGEEQSEAGMGDKRVLQISKVLKPTPLTPCWERNLYENNKWVRYLSLQKPT